MHSCKWYPKKKRHQNKIYYPLVTQNYLKPTKEIGKQFASVGRIRAKAVHVNMASTTYLGSFPDKDT